MLFCNIGDPKKLEAVLVIEQDDIEFIREEQSVAIKINEIPGWTYHSQIMEIAKNDMKITPRSLSQKGGGEVVSKQDEGVPNTRSTRRTRPALRWTITKGCC